MGFTAHPWPSHTPCTHPSHTHGRQRECPHLKRSLLKRTILLCSYVTFWPPKSSHPHTKSHTHIHAALLYVHELTSAHVVDSTMGHTKSQTKPHCVNVIITHKHTHIPGGRDFPNASQDEYKKVLQDNENKIEKKHFWCTTLLIFPTCLYSFFFFFTK